MRRNFVCIGILILILVVMVGSIGIRTFQVGMPHGYDGVVATAHSVEHDYENVVTISDPFYQGIDPDGLPTGLRASCNSPQYVGHVDADPIVTFEKVMVDGKEMNETKTIKVSRVNFEMNIDVETYGYGTHMIQDVSFWFELQNNPFSIFTGADEVAIAVIKVATTSRPVIEQKGDDIDFFPKAGGQQVALYTMNDVRLPDVPPWLEADYVVENIAKLQNVKFKIDVFIADPIWEVGWLGGHRVDCLVTFVLSIDVMLFGEWKVLKPWEKYIPPEPELTLWEQFLKWMEESSIDILPFLTLMAWVIVGFLATIVIFRFVPDLKLKLLATGIVWVVLLALYGLSAIEIWMGGG